jgi:hypothetical protein
LLCSPTAPPLVTCLAESTKWALAAVAGGTACDGLPSVPAQAGVSTKAWREWPERSYRENGAPAISRTGSPPAPSTVALLSATAANSRLVGYGLSKHLAAAAGGAEASHMAANLSVAHLTDGARGVRNASADLLAFR